MNAELKQFINENVDLIDQNTKESWEQIYKQLRYSPLWELTCEFTKIILDAGINDPASIMGYIPEYYLRKSNIQKYIIPDSVTTIGSWAFCSCESLTSVEIGDNVTSISVFAFSGCCSLKEIQYKGTKREAITKLKVKNKRWREGSAIEKIICSDEEIILQ